MHGRADGLLHAILLRAGNIFTTPSGYFFQHGSDEIADYPLLLNTTNKRLKKCIARNCILICRTFDTLSGAQDQPHTG